MKKLVLALLIAISAVCLAFGVAACIPDIPNHNYETKWSSDQYSHYHRCTDPGCQGKSDVADHEWELAETIEAPTCNEEGKGIYQCAVCGAEIKKAIEATGAHVWENEEGGIEATCGTPGSQPRHCAVCGTPDTLEIPPTGAHVWRQEWEITETGHTHKCANCGTTDVEEPHVEGNPSIKPVEGKVDGERIIRCAVCQYVLVQEPIVPAGVPFEFKPYLLQNGVMRLGAYTEGVGTFARIPEGTKYNLSLEDLLDADGNTANLDGVNIEVYWVGQTSEVLLDTSGAGSSTVIEYAGVGRNITLALKAGKTRVGESQHLRIELHTGEYSEGTDQLRATAHLYLERAEA